MMTRDSDPTAADWELQRGMTAARAGFRSVAEVHLARAAELAPEDSRVWMWLAWVASSPDNMTRCLNRVLELDPANPMAVAGRDWSKALAADSGVEVQAPAREYTTNEPTDFEPTNVVATSSTATLSEITSVEESDSAIRLEVPEVDRLELPHFFDITSDAIDAPTVVTATLVSNPTNAINEQATSSEMPVQSTDDWTPVSASLPVAVVDPVAESLTSRHVADLPADTDTQNRRWNDLVRRAAEMPLPPRSESPVVVADSIAADSMAAVTSSIIPETNVQSRFTEVPGSSSQQIEVAASQVSDTLLAGASELVAPTLTAPTLTAPILATPNESVAVEDVEALTHSFTPATSVSESDGRPLVMVVDDSPTVRKLVSLTLERRGYRVISAFDGVAAIKELGSCRPDLILLDINMPRLDGYRLCKLIKKHEATQSIPVVMLSGKDGMFDKLRGRLVGCSDYITKPFEADALTHKVAKYLNLSPTSTV